jgi:hypothetical protein
MIFCILKKMLVYGKSHTLANNMIPQILLMLTNLSSFTGGTLVTDRLQHSKNKNGYQSDLGDTDTHLNGAS